MKVDRLLLHHQLVTLKAEREITARQLSGLLGLGDNKAAGQRMGTFIFAKTAREVWCHEARVGLDKVLAERK